MTHLRLATIPQDAEPLLGLRRSVRVAVVAAALDMEPRRVRELVDAGELEGHRVGKRSIRIYEDSVDAYRPQRLRRDHAEARPA